MGFRHVLAAVLAMAVLSACAAAAAAAQVPGRSSFVRLPGVATTYTSTADRYFVYGDYPSDVGVLDTKTMKTRRYTLPAGCTMYSELKVAAGRSVFPCNGVRDDVLMDVASGTLSNVPKAFGRSSWGSIGRRWLSTGSTCSPLNDISQCRSFRNIETGEVRTLPRSRTAYDLDSVDLTPTKSCSPRAPNFPYETSVETGGQGQYGGFFISNDRPLTIDSCRRKHPVEIGGPRARVPEKASLLGGWLTYFQSAKCSRSAFAYQLATKRTYRWATPSAGGAHCVSGALHTRYAIVVPLLANEYSDTSLSEYDYRMVAARLPKPSR